jgi:hypothetical protein
MASPLVFAVNLKGVKELVAKVNDPNLVTSPMGEMMQSLADLAQKTAIEKANSSGIARTLMTDVSPTLARIHTPLKYAPTLNKGRRVGAKMPSSRDLQAWMSAKGIPSELGFVVARGIQRRGIKGRFFMRRARAAVRQAMPAAVARMGDQIERRFDR